MVIKKRMLLSVALFIIQFAAVSQTNPVKFSISQLRQDFKIFVQSLKEAHPGLYRYTTKEEFESLFKKTKKKIDHPMTEEEFYKLLMPLIADIKCGHTKFNRKGNPDNRYPFKTGNLFPLKMYFINSKAYVLDCYDTSLLIPRASEVLSINGKAIATIIRRLHNYITIDGEVQSALYQELNHSFNGYYATFIETAKSYTIVYKENGDTLSSSLPGISLKNILEREEKNMAQNKLPLRLIYAADSIAILTIDNFYAAENVQQYYPFVDSVFKDLKDKKVSNLIIDVRNNEGGEEDYGGYLYSYLTDKNFIYYKKLVLTKQDKYSFAGFAEMPPQLAFIHKFSKEKNGERLFTSQKYLSVQLPQKNNFTGKTYMLINGLSFSVTTELASLIHNNKIATFIGEETGGAYYGNNSGVFAIVTLPNTKLATGIPLVGFYSNVSGYAYKNRGILPDYTVTSSVDDIFSEKRQGNGLHSKAYSKPKIA